MFSMCLNQTVIKLINVSQNLKICVNLEEHKRDVHYQHFAMNFCPHKKSIEWKTYSLSFETIECDYNPRCIVSSGSIFDDIIMNLSGTRHINNTCKVLIVI